MNTTPADCSAILADAITTVKGGRIVVVTGAGISLASGIPTFRGQDPDAVWNKDVTELGTRRFFEADPVASWTWYSGRFDLVLDKLPNAAHAALTSLERWAEAHATEFLVVSQNIDTLHEHAGTRNLIKVHGSANRVRCSSDGCDNAAPSGSLDRSATDIAAFRANPCVEHLPRCPECQSVLRPHVLWFDECYDEHVSYDWNRVLESATQMDLVIFVGTSFAVGVTELFLQSATGRRIPAFSIDPGVHDAPNSHVVAISEPAETLLPELCGRLGVGESC